MAQAGQYYMLVMTADKQRAEVLVQINSIHELTARFSIVQVMSGSLPEDQLTIEHTCNVAALVKRIEHGDHGYETEI